MDGARFRHYMSEAARRQSEARQVARRASELLPFRLIRIEKEYRRKYSPARAKRAALKDPRYLAFVEELASISASVVEARVAWETGRMLWDARVSTEAFRTAAAWAGKIT